MKTVDAIDKLKDLEPDWDSYGASAIDLSAREQAKSFVHQLERALGPEYASPVVGPTPDGGVALIWRKPGQPSVEVFFSPAEGNRFVVLLGRKLLDRGPIADLAFIKQYVIP